VSDENTGDPIAGAWVYLYRDDGSGSYYYSADYTDVDGRYVFSGLSAADYRLTVEGSGTGYLNEWWQDTDEAGATVITLNGIDGAVADPQLTLGGTIAGTVTAEESGAPLTNTYVSLYLYDEESDSWYWASGGTTDEAGAYSFGSLAHGTYRAGFQDNDGVYLPEYYNGSAGFRGATDIVVDATPETGINASLVRGGQISGFVVDSDSLGGVDGAVVVPARYDPWAGTWSSDWGLSTHADATGAFAVTGLAPATYRFQVQATGYVTEWWEDAPNVELGTSWTVTDDTLQTGLDFEIDRTGSVSGTVYDLGSTPLSNVSVMAQTLAVDSSGGKYWTNVISAVSDGSGAYTIANMIPGTYRLRFYDQNAAPPYYLPEFYAEKPNVWIADDVTVTPGVAVNGIDAHMSAGASISGTVRDESSNPLQSVAVSAFAYDPAEDDWERYGSTVYTDVTGAYTIADLPDDTYRLGFSKSGYLPEYYPDQLDVFNADDVTIAAGTSVSGRNAVLAAGSQPPNGTLSGTVTSDDSGLGVANARVVAWRCDPISYPDGWYWANSTQTGGGGGYSMSLMPGVYRIQFSDQQQPVRFLSEYHEDAEATGATHVTVMSGSTTTVDAGLATGGAIAGTVTDEMSGAPLEGVYVYVYARFGAYLYQVAWTSTGADGTYTAGGLPTGAYVAYYQATDSGHRSEWYDDAASVSTAHLLPVDAGETLPGVDIALTPNHTVSGTVTDAFDGRLIHAIEVILYREAPDAYEWWDSTDTDPTGFYEIDGVPAGTYLVQFAESGTYGFTRYTSEYHADATRQTDATPVVVGPGDATVNAALDSTGTWGDISGRVIDTVTHGAIPDIAVRRWDPDGGGDWFDSGYGTSTSATGDWLMQWVPTGDDYRIAADPGVQVDGVTPWTGIYPRTFFDDDSAATDGLPVAVNAGAQTVDTIINVTPEPDVGYLSGHVIEDGTGADVAGATVTLYLDEGFWTQYTPFETDATGRFMRPVPSGTYAVELDDAPLHAREFYEDVDSWNPGDATPVVVPPAATTEMTASLEPLSSVSGRVTAETGGAPLKDVSVTLYEQVPDGGWDWANGTSSAADGTYGFSGVRYGTYTVFFDESDGLYVDEYYNHRSTVAEADTFEVNVTPTTGIDAALASAGSISGTITDAVTSLPVPDATVQVYVYDRADFSWSSVYSASSNGTGAYQVGGLPAGTYRVQAGNWGQGYAAEYYDGVRDVGDATDVPIGSAGHATGIDIALEKRGSISGTITDVTNGAPLDSAWVYAYRYRPTVDEWQYAYSDATDASGAYAIENLPPDTYRLIIYRSGYLSECIHDEYDIWAAADIPLAAGEQLTGVDEALSPGAVISGTIRDGGGTGIANIRVTALRYDPLHDVWAPAGSDWTDSSGYYEIVGLGDYEYRVVITDPYSRYQDEYYIDAADPAGATPVPVSLGVGATDVDAVLAPRTVPEQGTLSGIVRSDPGAAPLAGIEVKVARYDTWAGGWNPVTETATAADGTYSITLAVGTYRVYFVDPTGSHLNEFYHDGTESYWDGLDVVIAPSATTTANEGLRTAARIRGTVTADTGGAPLAGMNITVYRVDPESGYNWIGQAETAADGTYQYGGLTAGDYLVAFNDPNLDYLGEWYDDAAEAASSTWVTIAAAETREGVDAGLADAGSIGGTITDEASGVPASHVYVQLYYDYGSWTSEYGSAWSADDGSYLFKGLPPGTYYLKYSDINSPVSFTRFETEYHLDAIDLDTATPIVVAHARETVDAELTSTGTWGSIAGTVTDGVNALPVSDMRLALYAWDGAGFVRDFTYEAWTDASGDYMFPYVAELSAGAPYRVLAVASESDFGSVYVDTAHLDGATIDDGDNVVVAGGSYHADIDVHMIRLPDVAWVGGMVQSSATIAPLPGITVGVHSTASGHVADLTTASDGTWGRAVEPGDYTFQFVDPNNVYGSEWYHNHTAPSEADEVTVSPGSTVIVDETLDAAGRISGTVENSSGAPVETWVDLYHADTWDWAGIAYSSGGSYSFEGLRAGSYRVWFGSTGDYLGEYWNNRAEQGDDIVVLAGQTTGGIDAVLGEGGTVSGTIASDDGMLSGDVYVVYYAESPLGWEWSDSHWASEGAGDWAFESGRMIPGDYKVSFSASGYSSLWYDGKTTVDSATPVTVTDLETTPVELVFDGLPPEVNSDAVADYDNAASIEITATDLVTGVESVTYKFSGYDPVETPGASATFTSPAGALGTFEFRYWATDYLGQQSGVEVTEITITDTLAPTVESDALSSYLTTATITITADDGDGGGVASLSYRADGGTTQTVSADSVEVEVGGIGDHTLVFWARDYAGNESEHETANFTIADTMAPTVVDDAVASYDDVAVITLTATDNPGGEGVDYISWSLNGGPWTAVDGASAEVTVSDPGDHVLEYSATDLADNTSDVEQALFEVVRTGDVLEVPIAGDDRYKTAVAISKAAFDSADWVVIATGANWPDALGGSALAGALDGPILLTETNALPTVVRDEVVRLGADKAIILGGTSAVSTTVENALKTLLGAGDVERLGGIDRYRTADMIAVRAIAELGGAYDGTASVATGANYPDALAAAPLSAGLHWPLFLTPTTGLDAGTKAAMADVDEVLILGGTAVVPQAIEDSLELTYGDADVTRLAGADRYATAVVVATHGVANGLGWNRLAITTGEKFPDALAGGVLQGRDGSVMLLTPSTSLPASVRTVLQNNRSLIAEVRYLGGTTAVTQSVRDAVAAILDQ
jgi:putative cell wall-binding protein/5-hydroxyisourate hydrolase-like protein (transthyretin family)